MFQKKIFIDYKENGIPVDANEVVLASSDNSFGVKEIGGLVITPNATSVSNPSLGRYEYDELTLDENKVYIASWRVQSQPGGAYKYATQQFGPYDGNSQHNSSTEVRGVFAQGSTGSLFLRVFDINGVAAPATDVSMSIYDSNNTLVSSGFPEILTEGLYVYDWTVAPADAPDTLPTGTYYADWSYTFNGQSNVESQAIVLSSGALLDGSSLYTPRLNDLRESLTYMIAQAQKIPVYRDIPKPSRDNLTFQFSFPRWNQVSGVRIYVNKILQNDTYKIDFSKGSVTFDNYLTRFDTITADYNFRWFSDEELDRFLSNALHMLNLFPATSGYNLLNVPDRFLGLIFYGAAVDAIRSMMLSLMFQETQLVYGGAEAAKAAFGNLETLKKNYEDMWMEGLKQKKYGPYKGLTKMIVVPEYTLPGGRSRWFRNMFSGGS